MAIPRAKKKKRVNVPSKPEQTRIMEANYLCLAVAIEQMYSDCGWRVKRFSRIVDIYWEEMTEAKRIKDRIRKPVQKYIAEQAGEAIGENVVAMCSKLDDYRQQVYMLCIGCLVKALRRLKVSKLRCKLIIGEIIYDQKTYEVWSVCKECAEVTGYDVRVHVQWD